MADVARAMELGREAAAFVSEKFIRPVKLEFEKVGRAETMFEKVGRAEDAQGVGSAGPCS